MSLRAPRTWTLACVLALGCTKLVERHPERQRCVEAEPDPCPGALSCRDGYCVAPEGSDPDCVPRVEDCTNEVDDDCDGEIDEPDPGVAELCDGKDNDCDDEVDEGHDNDGDGNTWCGDIRKMGTGDCDEFNPAVFVGALEKCDGYDNDCNGKVDDAPAGKSLCAAGEECNGRCQEPSCAIPGSSAACADDERCDADTGECVPRSCGDIVCPKGQYCEARTNQCRAFSRMLGEACADDADCVSGACIQAAAVGITGGPVRVCGHACCRDQECSEGELCFAPGNGARSCLPSIMVARLTPAVSVCSTTAECEALQCRVQVVHGTGGDVGNAPDGFVTSACSAAPADKLKLAEICAFNADCASGICLKTTVLPVGGVCSTTCGSSDDCSAFENGVFGGLTTLAGGAYCRTLPTLVDGTHQGSIPTCVLDRNGRPGALGDDCNSGEDCADGVCATTPAGMKCAPACCNDADCNKDGKIGQCRPLVFGDHYEMRCIL